MWLSLYSFLNAALGTEDFSVLFKNYIKKNYIFGMVKNLKNYFIISGKTMINKYPSDYS